MEKFVKPVDDRLNVVLSVIVKIHGRVILQKTFMSVTLVITK